MHRKLAIPDTIDPVEQNRAAGGLSPQILRSIILIVEAAFADSPAPQLVRARYARPETEWQQKRRKQSYYYQQYLFEQDPWRNFTVNKEVICHFEC